MGMKLSVCGKGGSGKSTLTGLLAQQAVACGFGVLVVDSDESNSGLYRFLGFEKPPKALMDLVGGKKKLKGKMQQPNILHNKRISIKDIPLAHRVAKNGLSMVSIGKITRAFEGCACPMGVLNREFLKKLNLEKGEIALVDMEAGIEHFGRGIDADMDAILLVVEPSFESLAIANKIKEIAGDVNKRLWAVLNKVRSDDMKTQLVEALGQNHIEVVGVLPDDPAVFEAGLAGLPIGPCQSAEAAGKILDYCCKKTVC
jgi:CO dehydrogenase maturation factor